MEKGKMEFSINEAFRALNEIDDEDVIIPIKSKKSKVNEGGITVNLNNDDEIKEAQAALEKKDDEPALQVIDPDADSLEHLKKNIDYVGQMILKCKACHALHFIDAKELIESEQEKGVYNTEDECPNCHVAGKGFTILGQVGEIPTFDNDIEDEKDTEPVEETSTETEEEIEVDNNIEDESEEDVDDVELDDTEDLDLPKLGDEFDSDDVKADDTEEQVEEEETEETVEEALDTTDDETVEEVEKEEEVVEEEIPEPKAIDFIDKILEKNDKEIVIYDNSPDVKKIFEGVVQSIPHAIKEYKVVGFNSPKMIINIDGSQTPGEMDKVDYLVKFFNDNAIEDITVFDVDKDEEVFEGKIDDLLNEFKDSYLVSFEIPSKITLFVESDGDVAEIENEEVTVQEALVSDIIKENNLSESKINNPLANEFWINDAIQTGDDLDLIYEQYIIKTGNKDLIERFKKVTGYKDVVDEAKENFENKIKNNNRPFNEDFNSSEDVEIRDDKIYYNNSDIGSMSDEDWKEICDYIRDKFYPLDIPYSDLEIVAGSTYDYWNGPQAIERTVDHTYSVEKLDPDYLLDLLSDKFPNKLTGKDLKSITESDLVNFFEDVYYDKARDEAEEEYDIGSEGPDEDDYRNESLQEEATLTAKDELINKVADKIDKAIEEAKISVQTVTDESNPGQIGFLFISEEDRNKAKPIIDRVFKETRCIPGDIKEVQEDNAFGLTYDKIAIQLGIQLREHLCKDRKDLVEAIKNCKGNKYTIKRSLKEGYRYLLIEQIGDVTFYQGTSETAIAPRENELDPVVSKVVNKLMEVSKDTVEAIKDFYNIDVSPEFVLADMIKDLQLIKGDIDVEQLEENDITRRMYNSYTDFYNAFEDIFSTITGEDLHTTPEERFKQALRMLNSPNYSREGIRKAISSDTFLELAKAGEVPYLSADIARPQLTEEVDDGSDLFETPDTDLEEDDKSLNEDCKEEIKSKIAALTQDEWEATKGYTDAIEDIKDACEEAECECGEKINNVLDDIRDEEIVHVGELEELIDVVDDDTKDLIKDGQKEAEEKLDAKEDVEEVETEDVKYEVVNDPALDKAVADLQAKGISPADLELEEQEQKDEVVEESLENNDETFNPDDEATDKIDFNSDEFESEKFDDDLNEYFNESYEDTILYHTEKGQIDKEGNIVLEGYLETEKSKTPVKFLLQPEKTLNESMGKKVYKVTNNLSEEEFEFQF